MAQARFFFLLLLHLMFIHIFALEMNIKDAIKQQNFESEHHKVLVNLMYTHSWLTSLQQEIMKTQGLSIQQYNVLRILRGQHGKAISVNEISDRMIDKMSNCSRLVDKLKLKNWVQRKICPNDRRQVDIIITQSGLEILELLDAELQKVFDRLQSLSSNEAMQLNGLLDKLRTEPKSK